MNPRSQSIFAHNWNLIAKNLTAKGFKNIPFLQVDGNCYGLSLALADYVRNGNEDEFFKIYHAICDQGSKLTNIFSENCRIFNKVMKLITQVKFIQDKGYKKSQFDNVPLENFVIPTNTTQDEIKEIVRRFNLQQRTHEKMGYALKEFGSSKLRDYTDIEVQIKNLDEQDPMFFCIFAPGLDGHASLIYKANGIWVVFEPNVGEKNGFATSKEAARYLLRRFNDTYPLSWWMELFQNSATCKETIGLLAVLTFPISIPILLSTSRLRLSHSNEEKENKSLNHSILFYYTKVCPPTESSQCQAKKRELTDEQLKNVKLRYEEYKNSGFFGMFKRNKNNSKLEYLLDTPNQKMRYTFTETYINSHPQTKLTKALLDEVPSLRTKLYKR